MTQLDQHNSLVLERVVDEVLFDLPDDTDRQTVMRTAKRVGQMVLIKTNRGDLPPALIYTMAEIVLAIETGKQEAETEGGDQDVKSIKEGDVTVTFQDDKRQSFGEREIDRLMSDYYQIIRRYRKVKW